MAKGTGGIQGGGRGSNGFDREVVSKMRQAARSNPEFGLTDENIDRIVQASKQGRLRLPNTNRATFLNLSSNDTAAVTQRLSIDIGRGDMNRALRARGEALKDPEFGKFLNTPRRR